MIERAVHRVVNLVPDGDQEILGSASSVDRDGITRTPIPQ